MPVCSLSSDSSSQDPEKGTTLSPVLTMPCSVTVPSPPEEGAPALSLAARLRPAEESVESSFPEGEEGTAQAKASWWGGGVVSPLPLDIQQVGGRGLM